MLTAAITAADTEELASALDEVGQVPVVAHWLLLHSSTLSTLTMGAVTEEIVTGSALFSSDVELDASADSSSTAEAALTGSSGNGQDKECE